MRFIKLIVVALLLTMLPLQVFASDLNTNANGYYYLDNGYEYSTWSEDMPTPYFNGISSVLYRFVAENGKAWASIVVTTYPNQINKAEFIVKVQKNVNGSWQEIKRCNQETFVNTEGMIYFDESVTISKGQYRMVTEITAYKGNTLIDHTVKTSTINFSSTQK